MAFSIVMIFPSIILIYISFKMLLETNHETDIFLGDNTLTVVKKAIFCRRIIQNYQKNDLSRIEFTHRIMQRKGRRNRIRNHNIYELFLIFKNGQREQILIDSGLSKIYTDEEIIFLANYINNYINNQIRL